MKKDTQGRFTQNGHGIGTVTDSMVMRRAKELAAIAGRERDQVLDMDIEQARQELTGQEEATGSSREDELPEEKRWVPVPESEGHKAPVVGAADEQTFAEELVEEGLEDAEQDSMLEAIKSDRKNQKNR